jgi:hypothetical protein
MRESGVGMRPARSADALMWAAQLGDADRGEGVGGQGRRAGRGRPAHWRRHLLTRSVGSRPPRKTSDAVPWRRYGPGGVIRGTPVALATRVTLIARLGGCPTVGALMTKDYCTYTTIILRQEKTLRDHGRAGVWQRYRGEFRLGICACWHAVAPRPRASVESTRCTKHRGRPRERRHLSVRSMPPRRGGRAIARVPHGSGFPVSGRRGEGGTPRS